jgi:hypothetical protein
MKMLLAMAVLTALTGCTGETAAQRAAAAEFRAAAREIYSSLERPSCAAPKGFARADFLRPEHAAVTALDRRMAGTPASAQLALAHADAALAPGCSNDSNPTWAKMHVQMTREHVAAGVAKLNALAPRLASVKSEAVPPHAAAFRQGVHELIGAVEARCTHAVSTPDTAERAQKLIAGFRKRLGDGAYRRHYAIAEADQAYTQSITLVECAQVSTESPEAFRDRLLADLDRRIAALDALLS